MLNICLSLLGLDVENDGNQAVVTIINIESSLWMTERFSFVSRAENENDR